jgi:hypothetical protein
MKIWLEKKKKMLSNVIEQQFALRLRNERTNRATLKDVQ